MANEQPPVEWGEGQSEGTAPDDVNYVGPPGFTNSTLLDDLWLAINRLYNCSVTHRCLSADLLDGKHGAYYGLYVAGDEVGTPNLVEGDGIDISVSGSDITIALDIDGLTAETPVAADTFAFHDATDSTPKKVTLTNLATAMGVGGGDVTAAANLTDDAIVLGDGGAKGVKTTGIFLSDLATADPDGTSTTGNLASFLNTDGRSLEDSGIAKANVALNSDNLSELTDPATARTNLGLGDRATQDDGDNLDAASVSAEDIAVGRTATSSITEADTPILDLNSVASPNSNVRKRVFAIRRSISSGAQIMSWAVGTGENYLFRLRVLRKRTDSGNQSAWQNYSWLVQDIGGAITITAIDTQHGGVLAAANPSFSAAKGGTPVTMTIGPTAGTEVWNGHIEVEGPLAS